VKSTVKLLAAIATIGIFLVLIMGAAVTNTGSEQGCGRSWPLCHGQLIPQMAVATAIEFSHRAVVGIESILIISLAVAALALYRHRKEMKILAPLMVAFLFVQAGLGAWAVMYPQEAAILALHFGVSLISFASVLLTAVFLFEVDRGERMRSRTIPRRFRQAVWGITLYSYFVVYLGAFVRHLEADEACSGWPLCNGDIVPGLQGKVAAAFAHRCAAGLLVLAIVGLVVWSYRMRAHRPDLYRASHVALGLVVLQALVGALVVVTRVDLFSALAHAALAGALFGSLTYLCLHVLPLPAGASQRNASGLAAAS
jgi:heme a synthase